MLLSLLSYLSDELLAYTMTQERCFNSVLLNFIPASEKDLELEPRPPVTVKKTRLEDVFDVHEEVGK